MRSKSEDPIFSKFCLFHLFLICLQPFVISLFAVQSGIRRAIFDNGLEPEMIFCHDSLIKNCYGRMSETTLRLSPPGYLSYFSDRPPSGISGVKFLITLFGKGTHLMPMSNCCRQESRTDLNPPGIGILYSERSRYVPGTAMVTEPDVEFVIVVNLTAAGVAISTPKAIETGTSINLGVYESDHSDWQFYAGKIKWTRRQDGGSDLHLAGEPRSSHVDAETDMSLWYLNRESSNVIAHRFPGMREFPTALLAHWIEERPFNKKSLRPGPCSKTPEPGGSYGRIVPACRSLRYLSGAVFDSKEQGGSPLFLLRRQPAGQGQ